MKFSTCFALCALAVGPAYAGDASVSLKMSAGLNAAPAASRAPAELPASPRSRPASLKDYRIGAEDLLDIQVFGVDQLSRAVRVSSNGQVSLPLIGTLAVAGLTAQEAEALVAQKLATDYLQDPQVSLFIKEYTTQRVTIEGAVVKPGIYPLRGETTLLRAIAIAGGQGSLADLSAVILFRTDAAGKRAATPFDLERIRRGELDDPTVQNDDVIVVNRSPTRTALKDSVFRDLLDVVNPFAPYAR